MNKKINIAFIKFGGMSAGGTEKFLQTIAMNLPPDRFNVDYYYCDTAPYTGSGYKHPGTDENCLNRMVSSHVNLIEFKVGAKDTTKRTHDWVDTNFWEVFDEKKYDLIQTGRAGHPEYPFNKIRKIPIVDSLHLLAGIDNQFNISRVMHICNWSAEKWIFMGGDKNRVVLVSHPMEIKIEEPLGDFREELGIDNKNFVYGFHQRNDDNIFSSIPLAAYKEIESDNTAFILMGGSNLYRKQAEDLKLKNIFFIDHSSNLQRVYKFLNTLDVYAHGRLDGEVNSTAMAEAMYFGLPIVSHSSKINNGHIECIDKGGKVVDSLSDYSKEMLKLKNEKNYYIYRSKMSQKRFVDNYEIKGQIKNIINIYEDVLKNPYPNKFYRIFMSLRLRYIFMYSFVRVYKKIIRLLKNI